MTEVLLKRTSPLSASFLVSLLTHFALFGFLIFTAQKAQKELVTIDFVEVPSSSNIGSKAQVESKPSMAHPSLANEDVAEVANELEAPSVSVAPAGRSEALESSGEGTVATPLELNATKVYQDRLVAQLNANKFYPPLAKKLRQQGVVLVQFRVSRFGKVLEAKVIKESPFKSLNESAKKLVEGIQDLAPFPKEISKTTWLFEVPVKYQM